MAMLARKSDKDGQSAPTFWRTVFKLYRSHETWRGAVDLILIGLVVMYMATGTPNISQLLKSLIPETSSEPPAAQDISLGHDTQAMPVTQTSHAAVKAPSATVSKQPTAQVPAAKFTPLDEDADKSQKVQSAIPAPAKNIMGWDMLAWLGSPSADELQFIKKIHDTIGRDYEQAIRMAQEKAEAGNPNFEFLMGRAYAYGAGKGAKNKRAENFQKSLVWFEKAAVQGHPDAQYVLGQIYRLGGLGGGLTFPGFRVDYRQAARWYLMAVDNPHNVVGDAENQIGRMYGRGQYFVKDGEKQAEYYRRSAEKGNYYGQGNLGGMYLQGDDIGKDVKKGLYWLRLSASQGYNQSQFNLAQAYKMGHVTGHPDYTNYLKWMGAAAENNYVPAMLHLGNFYREGKPSYPPDQEKSAKFYRQAALKNDKVAQYRLAELFERGAGVPQDNIQAYIYYKLAYKNMYTPAIAAWETLKQRMTPNEIDYAEQMAAALTVSKYE